jgi:hypothetical protein
MFWDMPRLQRVQWGGIMPLGPDRCRVPTNRSQIIEMEFLEMVNVNVLLVSLVKRNVPIRCPFSMRLESRRPGTIAPITRACRVLCSGSALKARSAEPLIQARGCALPSFGKML